MEQDHQSRDSEALIFAKVVRHLAERLGDVEPDTDPGDLAHTGALFEELADAFETTGGFSFAADQTSALSHAFAMLEGGMHILTQQATEQGKHNAAAKMQWAANRAHGVFEMLETHITAGTGGVITLGSGEDSVHANVSTS